MVFQRSDKGGESSVPCDHWVTTFEQVATRTPL